MLAWAGTALVARAQPAEWQWTPTNASGVMLGQATINGVPAEAADWIGAFDPAGNCAGAAPMILNDGLTYFNLPIYGDDASTTNLDEGITAGEPFTLRIWQAVSNSFATYPNDDAPEYLNGWSNTNGAPIPAYSDPTVHYDFALVVNLYLTCPGATCVSGPVQSLEWGPPGGVISGPGVSGVYWDPAVAGEGVHELAYTLGDTAVTCSVEVSAAPDATISSVGPVCANDPPLPLAAESPGGTWSGEGVLGAFFDPALIVPPGNFAVTYVVGGGFGCVDSATISITVFPSPPPPYINTDVNGNVLFAMGGGNDIAAYQWNTINGGPVEGATGQTFDEPMDGVTYFVTVTNSYGCSSDSDPYSYVAPNVGDVTPGDWRVWWNPQTSTIESNRPIDRVEWFDATGRPVTGPTASANSSWYVARIWKGSAHQTLRMLD